MISAVGAIGLNLVTGYAGQVSLGHAFFIGLGAYTGAVLGGDTDAAVTGYGLPIYVWLPAAGVVAAFAGLLVGPHRGAAARAVPRDRDAGARPAG